MLAAAPFERCRVQDHGFFLQRPDSKNAQEAMMANPEMMQDMMKKNLGGLVPQVQALQHT